MSGRRFSWAAPGFGGDWVEAIWRRLAVYVDRVLRGESPATMPMEQPTVFRLIINRPAANALGLDIKTSLLVRADEVIE